MIAAATSIRLLAGGSPFTIVATAASATISDIAANGFGLVCITRRFRCARARRSVSSRKYGSMAPSLTLGGKNPRVAAVS